MAAEERVDERGDRVKILFELAVDGRGWPPVRGEGMWASPLGQDTYRVASVPWFVCNIAEGDIVRAASLENRSVPLFLERLSSGGSCTIRVMPFEDGPLKGDLGAVFEAFAPLGVSGERCGPWPLAALSIPPDADAAAVVGLLRAVAGGRCGRSLGIRARLRKQALALTLI